MIRENSSIDLEEIFKKEKLNNNNKNAVREELNLKRKTSSLLNEESNSAHI
jgi:hypothetical protein